MGHPRFNKGGHRREWARLDEDLEDSLQAEGDLRTSSWRDCTVVDPRLRRRYRANLNDRGYGGVPPPLRGNPSAFFQETAYRGGPGGRYGDYHLGNTDYLYGSGEPHRALGYGPGRYGGTWEDSAERWLRDSQAKFRQNLDPVSMYSYDPGCPYCTNLGNQQPLLNTAAAAATSFNLVKGPDGTENVLTSTSVPPEKLPANEINGGQGKWNVWYSDTPGNEHTVIAVDRSLIECQPKTSHVHITNAPDLDRWRESYHHSNATPINGVNCYVAFTPSEPKTHVWLNGVAIHISEMVNLTVTENKDARSQDRDRDRERDRERDRDRDRDRYR
ncbi:hypothetical protein GNI_011770 [Gregarina niphandrodes]|uniref:Uncharacterized protein n=1 Tax=Gregarina niphandrodes TaxID=110365 RepID=A0A023BCL8_GRENI|nr:hypothetical protein GNI_011770 [Gregarina niphandrodes]EZG85432.1 hypothetical protein GNI_011770 [Gregarina niphandrodes]|eukprot:XP_011128828.1 hypothetical protein GNI_011770 [Gregarina niphandrodes]